MEAGSMFLFLGALAKVRHPVYLRLLAGIPDERAVIDWNSANDSRRQMKCRDERR
jgi:hypothetical protein